MKRFSVVLLALVVIAAMAVPAMAADNLSLSGQMRVRGWAVQDDTPGGDSPYTTYMDQRLRIGGKLAVAEGVSISFRTDVTERTWGNGGSTFGAGRMPQDGQQWDRAYIDLNSGDFHLRAGQQYVGYGIMGGTVNSQDAGFKVDKGNFSAFFLLDAQKMWGDSYLTAAQYGQKADGLSYNVFLADQIAVANADEDVKLIAANVATSFGAINVKGEVDLFTGDADATTDAVGTQLLVDGSTAVGDRATVGGQLYYAASADTGEAQYEYLGNDFNGWDPLADVGTSLSNEQIIIGRPFDFTGDGAGVTGLRVYGNVKSSDALNYGASIAYLAPEDDDLTAVDSAMAVALGTVYKVMANTSVQGQLQYESVSLDGSTGPDPEDTLNLGVGLFVNF